VKPLLVITQLAEPPKVQEEEETARPAKRDN
jgi:hypothetical protein